MTPWVVHHTVSPSVIELSDTLTRLRSSGRGGQIGMARSVVWARFLSLHHTQITLSNTANLSVASRYMYMGDRLLSQEIANPRLPPPTLLRRNDVKSISILAFGEGKADSHHEQDPAVLRGRGLHSSTFQLNLSAVCA
jgi:hypothetical protein